MTDTSKEDLTFIIASHVANLNNGFPFGSKMAQDFTEFLATHHALSARATELEAERDEWKSKGQDAVSALTTDAIAEAVKVEREACAQEMDRAVQTMMKHGSGIQVQTYKNAAKSIRSRGEGERQ